VNTGDHLRTDQLSPALVVKLINKIQYLMLSEILPLLERRNFLTGALKPLDF
jgi:hypothetical protein